MFLKTKYTLIILILIIIVGILSVAFKTLIKKDFEIINYTEDSQPRVIKNNISTQ